MATPLIPQEIFLLERYTSFESLEQVRDAWRAMLNYAEDLLDRFMQQLPPDYRNRPLPEQPDIVWGERVLPNFRGTMQWLDDACIKRVNNDFLCYKGFNLRGDIRGQGEYWSGWMNEVEPDAEDTYYDLLHRAGFLAKPIEMASGGVWSPGDFTTAYDQVFPTLPLAPPLSWPVYRLNTQVKVKSGERNPVTGFYLPDVDDSVPTLLIKTDDEMWGEAPEASVTHSDGADAGYLPCTWTLIERIADSGGGTPGQSDESITDARIQRVPGGQACPMAGWWYTLAAQASRHYFNKGDVMPKIGDSSYGDTYWLWDADQGSPKL